jgi:DNA-binding beta-propeller fold protein YncE
MNNIKTTILCILLAIVSHANCQNLVKIWETNTLMAKPESAVYDSINQVIYVSNINGKYCAHDGNGFISKVDLSGNIVELKWITGLNSPQGLAFRGNDLYVADNESVLKIDIRRGKIVKAFKINGAIFLNDAAADCSELCFLYDQIDVYNRIKIKFIQKII